MTVSQTVPHGTPVNPLIPFDFEENPIRVILDEHGAPWFHAGDVCRVLGYANPRQALESHVDKDDVQKLDAVDTLGRTQQSNYVNESGLYALIFGSTKPEAKRFKRWVTQEVLPAIRQSGGYGLSEPVREALEGVLNAVQTLNQAPAPTTPSPSRSELRAKYHGGGMDYQQAIQPIHLEYGQPWTTSVHLSVAADLNHPVLADQIISEMVHDGKTYDHEIRRIQVHAPSTRIMGSFFEAWQLSEVGVEQVIDALLLRKELNEEHQEKIRAIHRDLTTSFAKWSHSAPPRRGHPHKPKSTMADAIDQLARIINPDKGGYRHG